MSNIEKIPEDLVTAIEERRCVAFVGAGLSQGAGFPGWKDLLETLIQKAVDDGHERHTEKAEELRSLVGSGDTIKLLAAAQELRDTYKEGKFEAALRSILQDDSKEPTAAHQELPKIPFSFVITTNYDKLIEYAYDEYTYAVLKKRRSLTPLTGNDAGDFADKLFKGEFFILKAHGDIEKSQSLVITERDYRRLFYFSPGYKTALSAVFTTKTILFLGCSLADPELWLLLGYLHDAFHSSGRYHYALIPKGEASDTMFNRWRDDFSVHCIEYTPSAPDHPEVVEFLKALPHR